MASEIMFVGEQPGDQEDLAGKPFVGPAGRVLDEAMVEAGIDRGLAYVTNAVKHFSGRREASAVSTRSPTPPSRPRVGRGSRRSSRS